MNFENMDIFWKDLDFLEGEDIMCVYFFLQGTSVNSSLSLLGICFSCAKIKINYKKKNKKELISLVE